MSRSSLDENNAIDYLSIPIDCWKKGVLILYEHPVAMIHFNFMNKCI